MKCWNCGVSMVVKEDDRYHPYDECPKCGATSTDLPTLSYDPLAPHGFYLESAEGTKVGRMRRPSRSTLRDAAKARATK